jgi:transcriptional regulator with XRE-family HTH domain
MVAPNPNPAHRLSDLRSALGMSYSVLAARSGVSEPTVKRILGGRLQEASYANVSAIAAALGAPLGLGQADPDELCRQEARRKAERIARLVQGTSALENQAVDRASYDRLVERSYHELLAGSRRKLWSD